MAELITSVVESRSIDWWSVHLYVLPLLEEVGSWPMAGTTTWQQLDDNDPVKMAAVFDAGRHHALRIDTAQTGLAQASRDISAAIDWSLLSRTITRRSGVFIPRMAS